MSESGTTPHATAYCGHCGEPVDSRDHTACGLRLVMEPPRFCTECRRRMKVQVTPRGWAAECVEHGVLSS